MGLFGTSSVSDVVMQRYQQIMDAAGVVRIPELVRQVYGADSSQWHESATKATGVADRHEQSGDRASKMLQRLESSWTGEGAEAASGRIRANVKVSQTSSEVYGANARQYADGAYAFDSLKSQLTPMENQAPERSAWDSLTPWDTDTEDQVNRYNAQLEQNRQAYQSYEQAMKSSQSGVRTDFGDVSSLGGGFGDITIGKDGAGRNGTDHSTGIVTFDESSSGSRNNPPGGSAVPPVGGPGSVNVPSPGGGPSSYMPGPSAGDDSTSTSGYMPPGVTSPAASTSNYQPPGLSPSTGFGPNSGGGSSSYSPGPGSGSIAGTLGGFGSTGGTGGTGGKFSAPGLGSGSGSGSGGSGSAAGRLTGGGAGAVGAGKGTAAGPLGAAGSGSAGAAGTSAGGTGAAGRGGMGAMGGAGAGRGKGSDDDEHQRRFVQNDDEAFALTEDGEVLRDPETGNVITPPTIGG